MKLFKFSLIIIILCSLTACAQAGAKELAQGNQAFQQKDYVQALDKYQAAQKAAPDNAEPIYNAANVQYEQGAYDLAQARAEQALKHANGDLAENTHFNLGNSYFKQQQFDKAVEAYKKVLWDDPNAADAKYNLELAQKKLAEQQQQQQQEQQNQENKDQQNQDNKEQQEQQNKDNKEQKDKQDQQNQDNKEQQNKDKSQDDKSASDQQKQADKDKQQSQAGQSGDDKQKSDDKAQQSQVQTVRLTPEQARQLLESVARNAQSLPQFLQLDTPPSSPNQPQQDW